MVDADLGKDKDGFTFVKKKGANRRNTNPSVFFTHPLDGDDSDVNFSTVDKNSAISRILAAKEDILESDFYASATAIIREGLDILGKPEIQEIICYGLGHISDSMISRHQLAFLLCLIDKFPTLKLTYIYDPLFNDIDKEIIQHFKATLLPTNEEGKRTITKSTLLYFPHCPQILTNNFLYANWCVENLKNCILIANSFSSILESTPKRLLEQEAGYIEKIAPYVDELYIINTFKYSEIFNNTSLHIFPEDKICIIDPDFWSNHPEPNYSNINTDFISNISPL